MIRFARNEDHIQIEKIMAQVQAMYEKYGFSDKSINMEIAFDK